MKKLLLFLIVCAGGFGASAQLDGVVAEFYGNGNGGDVYRVYAEMTGPNDFVSAVYAASGNTLNMGSDVGTVLNHMNGSTLGDQLQIGFCGFIADICNDSYLTIGFAGTNMGVMYHWDDVTPFTAGSYSNVVAVATSPSASVMNDSFGNSDSSNLDMVDGSWFAPNAPGANTQGLGFGANNRVLLAQVAIPAGAELQFCINLSVFPDAVGANEVKYLWNSDNVINPTDIDGSLMGLKWPIPVTGVDGCMDTTACNYNSAATIDDGSCILPDGCTDSTACNYDSTAQCDDGSCAVDDACGNCGGSDTAGCTDSTACNYDSSADCDDSSCLFDDVCGDCGGSGVAGCTDASACNFNSAATCDDGSCLEDDACGNCGGSDTAGCTDSTACNYDSSADCDDSSCLFDDECGNCGGSSTSGCTNSAASNYDSTASCDDGSCILDGDGGCTDSTACNYDSTATTDDGSCSFDNDGADCPTAIAPGLLGSANCIAGNMTGATASSESDQSVPNAVDRWYSFVAESPGVAISLSTTDFDAMIELHSTPGTMVAFEDAVLNNGTEIFNYGNLVEGAEYYISARSFGAIGGGAYDICVETLPDTRCDYGSGPYGVCATFKADWVGCDDYLFNFTSQSTSALYTYQSGFANTFVQLGDIDGLEYGDSYDVAINSIYNRADGNGNTEIVVVDNNEPCVVNIDPHPAAAPNANYNCTSNGPMFLGQYLPCVPWICGNTDWEWEFTRTDVSELPITHLRGSNNRYLRLSDVAGLVGGGTYDVRVRPVFAAASSTYGATVEICIVGSGGAPQENIPFVTEDLEERDVVETSASVAIYPNPVTQGNFNLNLSGVQSEIITLDILDLTGKTVQAEQITVSNGSVNTVVELADVASGVYMVRMVIDGKLQTERLVVEK